MLNAHYNGEIDISEHWNVGDTRLVHLNAMSAGTGANESHVEQNMTMVILDFNHDDLKTPIGTKNKAAVTIQCREVLGNNGNVERGLFWGTNISFSNTTNYSQNPRRTWLNETFVNTMSNEFNSLIKTVVKKNLANHTNSTAGPNTEDKAFLVSYPEVFGNASYSDYKGNTTLEGNQYKYYETSANRIKKPNNNGDKSNEMGQWWLRSPCTSISGDFGYTFLYVTHLGEIHRVNGYNSYDLAPAFCL